MKSLFTLAKEKIGLFPLFLSVLIIILLISFSVSTRWVPVSKKINTTDAYNLTVEIDGIYSYAYNNYVLQDTHFENINALVPKGSFELEYAFFLSFMVAVLVVLLTRKREVLDIATKEEIEAEARKECNRLMTERKIRSYSILPQGALKQVQIGSDEMKPVMWMIPSDYTLTDETPEHHLLMFNPITRMIYEDRKIDGEFTGEDRCFNCGLYSDLKMVKPSDLKLLDELFGWTKGWGKRG